MLFGLMNARTTFQRAMDTAFADERDKFVVIYMDDITVYSRWDKDHIRHLEMVFIKYSKYGISLNPRKSNFALEEGKLLGHIISKEGIKIHPDKVKGILRVEEPRSKKEIQYFIGQVNFLRRFIPSFTEILMDITYMLRKDHGIKWMVESKKAFKNIKQAISEAPVLVSPDIEKDSLVFSYVLEHIMEAVLLQNDQGEEHPIAFFSNILRDREFKYHIMEKQTYALVKSLKYLRVYIFHSHIVDYVPINAVKKILTELDLEGKREKWISVFLEYDLKINPTKLVNGQGLAKLMTDSNYESLQLNFLSNPSNQLDPGL